MPAIGTSHHSSCPQRISNLASADALWHMANLLALKFLELVASAMLRVGMRDR
jgi:hypothetical protein